MLSSPIERSFVAALIVIASVAPAVADDSAKPTLRPNIVVILADDLGWGSLNCYGADEAMIRTPAIDRLAREGRRFTDANTTSSVCTPTRYSLLTGRYCWRTSLKFETLPYSAPPLIEPGRLTLASMLKTLGYRTAAIGKWHLGYGSGKADYTGSLRPGPLDIGFDYHFGVPSNHGDLTGVYVENDHVFGLRSSELKPADRQWKGGKFLGLDAPQRVDDQVMPTLTDRAVAWIDEQKPGEPFFLYYTPVAVHTPITPSAATRDTSSLGAFGDWIHELDRSVGRVLEALDRRGLAENTLVLFTSDNGGVYALNQQREETVAVERGFKPNGSFRDGKVHVYEGGFRVPYLVRWPGFVPAGSTCDEMISAVDTLATVAAIVGYALPEPSQGAEDSYSILPAWLGTGHRPIRASMIDHSCHGNFAIRQGGWKYIEGKLAPGVPPRIVKVLAREAKPQLFNLADDPREEHDVLAERADVAARLQALLDQQRDAGHTRPAVASLAPHPEAVANSHASGEVDNPALVPFIVAEASSLPGIVVDDTAAKLIGAWQYSTHTPPYVGLGYLHDQKTDKGQKSATFIPDLPRAGMYEVRLAHCYNVRRATNTPVTIHHADGETTVRIDQQSVPEHDRLFRTLGTFRFEAGRGGWVRIANDGTDPTKVVIADAVQWISRAADE